MKKLMCSLSVILCCVSYNVRAENFLPAKKVAEPQHIQLPDSLRNELNKSYAGFRIAEKKDYCDSIFSGNEIKWVLNENSVWSYGALKGDFNDDKRDDYSIIIAYPKSNTPYLWLAALQKQNGQYEIYPLGEPGPVGEKTPKVVYENGKICGGFFNLTKVGTMARQWESTTANEKKDKIQKIINNDAVAISQSGAEEIFYYADGKWLNDFSYEP